MNDHQSFGGGLIVYALCALLAWLAWPWIKQALGPDLTTYMSRAAQMRIPHMRLDPNEVSPNIEDRRPRNANGNLAHDAGGDDISRHGGGPVESDGRIIGCLDTYTGRRVDIGYCTGGGG
jgi:hypothetical protein